MIEMIIPYRSASIGAMEVKRILPYRQRRSVGPFVFVDEMGPVEFVNGRGPDVLSHPHIGLATVTYLFEGRMTHRDSIGSLQVIEPGDVNLMSAGRWIIHSERSSDAGNTAGSALAGLQTWLALPAGFEDSDPQFAHYHQSALPFVEDDGLYVKMILGALFGIASPVVALAGPVYAECGLAAGSVISIPREIEERAVYVLAGSLDVDGVRISPGDLAVFVEGTTVEARAAAPVRMMILGGDRLDAPRTIWWNFVSTSRERIEEAKMKWFSGEWEPISGESGHVPLPKGSFPIAPPL